MRGFDEEKGWRADQAILSHAVAADAHVREAQNASMTKGMSSSPSLKLLAETVVGTGVDLEYGVRA